MAFVIADRVRETTTTTGTGTITLGGAATGFQTFSAAIGNSNSTYYCITDSATGDWEVGIGTYTSSGNTLSRDTILSSSNSGSVVPFSAGSKDVFVTQPAERAVYVNGTDIIAENNASLKAAYGGTGLTSPGASGNVLTSNGTTWTSAALPASVVTLDGVQTLTNKTLTAPVISTISNTGTLTLPTSTDTLVGRATTDTLTNKTLSTGTTLGAQVTGGDFILTRTMFQDTGWDYYDSNTTSALDYVNGSVQRWAPSGTVSLTLSNWPPSGNLGELLIEGINLGAATITWPTINWITSTGATTTTFASNGVTLQTSGTDWVFLWTRDGGTTIYGKVVR